MLIFASCSGVTNHGKITLDKKANTFQVKVRRKHHNWWLGTDKEVNYERARAWVTNIGGNHINISRKRYDLKKTLPDSKFPVFTKPMIVAPGEHALFFEGEISQLGTTFRRQLPRGGAKLRIDVIFNETPIKPIHCNLFSTYGGP